MTQALSDYTAKLSPFDDAFLNFLRTSESIQENLRIREVRPAQAQMLETTGDLFRRFGIQFLVDGYDSAKRADRVASQRAGIGFGD